MKTPLVVDVSASLVRHPSKRYRTRGLPRINTAVMHHSAAPVRRDGNHLKQVEAFAAYHVESHDWPAIAYPYVIAPDGTVYKTNQLSKITWHCPGANSNGVGICLMGDFRYTEPTEQQLVALLGLIEELRKGLPNLRQVIGHYDKVATVCPGPKFLPALQPHLALALPRIKRLVKIGK